MQFKTTNTIPTNKISNYSEEGFLVRKMELPDHIHETKYSSHRDDFYLFAYIKTGEIKMFLDFKEYVLVEGNIIIITPGQVHKFISADEKASGYIIGVAPEHFSESMISELESHAFSSSIISVPADLKEDIDFLYDFVNRRKILSGVKTLSEIIIQNIEDISNSLPNRYSSITVRFKKLLDANYKEIKSPSKYAEMMNISPVYLNEAVKSVTGMSVTNFIHQHIVLLAKRMFLHTGLSAKEIAYALGYEDYPYFSRIFRKIEGGSPNKFLKNLK